MSYLKWKFLSYRKKELQMKKGGAEVIYVVGKRGCGFRAEGGIYLECGLVKDGRPIEHSLFDPPRPLDGLEVSAQGVHLVKDPQTGVYHVLDWVGQASYPHVADFVEEVRMMGLSRRAAEQTNFELLTKDSTIILIHKDAILDNPGEFAEQMEGGYTAKERMERWGIRCAVARRTHSDDHFTGKPVSCTRHWYRLQANEVVQHETRTAFLRNFNDVVKYTVDPPPLEADTKWATKPGMFMRLPITRIAVIESGDGTHIEKRDRIQNLVPGIHVDISEA